MGKRTCLLAVACVLVVAGAGSAALTDKAIWVFDGSANDSLNVYHGTENGTVTYVADHPSPVGGVGYDYAENQALSLNANGYVRIDTDAWLSPGSGVPGGHDVLVEFWLKTASTSSDMRILYFANDSGQYAHNYQISMTSGTVNFLTRTNVAGQPWNGTWYQVASTASVNNDAWHHVVCTNDGTDNKIYIDGVLDKSIAAPGPSSNCHKWSVRKSFSRRD